MQALEDLIVQTEIFLQYSLQSKATERLQKIAAMFPGEEQHNARFENPLRNRELVAAKYSGKNAGSRRANTRAPDLAKRWRPIRPRPVRTQRIRFATFQKLRRSTKKFSASRHRAPC